MVNRSKRKKHLALLRSSQAPVRKRILSNKRHFTRVIARLAVAGAAIVLFVIFGIPLIQDLVSGVDPSLRYTPQVKSEFDIEGTPQSAGSEGLLKSDEIMTADSGYNIKNDPYMDGDTIIFSSDTDKSNGLFLNTVVLYDTVEDTFTELSGVDQKYDNILETKLSGHWAVWVDSLVLGGGRICAYDLSTGEMFVVKEYAYTIPEISLSGDRLAFMQVAGEDAQRLYLYDLSSREGVTLRLYDAAEKECGAVSLSATDMVWPEYSTGNRSYVQRLLLSGGEGTFDNPDFGESAYGPKTNGTDIVFTTTRIPEEGDLMLSMDGDVPVKIAEGVLSYEIGTDYVVYMKGEQIYAFGMDSAMQTVEITSEATRGVLSSVNGNKVCFYDTTDETGSVDIVRFIDLGEING
jgi:hypothetical protein